MCFKFKNEFKVKIPIMKYSFFKNLAYAIGIYVLITALTHIVILLIDAIKNCDFSRFNYFAVIDAQLFLPDIATGKLSYAASVLLSLTIIGLLFFIIRKRSR